MTVSRNRSLLLAELYESLLFQTYRNFEWVLVDDSSEDETKELVENWLRCAKIPIKYYRNEVWLGKTVGNNFAYRASSGEYIIEIDSDDLLIPSALEDFERVIKGNASETFSRDRAVQIFVAQSFSTNEQAQHPECEPNVVKAKLKDIPSLKEFTSDGPMVLKRELYTAEKLPEIDFYVPGSFQFCKFHYHDCIFIRKQLKIQRYQNSGISKSNPLAYSRGRFYAVITALNTLGASEVLIHFGIIKNSSQKNLFKRYFSLARLFHSIALLCLAGEVTILEIKRATSMKYVFAILSFSPCAIYSFAKFFLKYGGIPYTHRQFERNYALRRNR